jgi:hypothetical protein
LGIRGSGTDALLVRAADVLIDRNRTISLSFAVQGDDCRASIRADPVDRWCGGGFGIEGEVQCCRAAGNIPRYVGLPDGDRLGSIASESEARSGTTPLLF